MSEDKGNKVVASKNNKLEKQVANLSFIVRKMKDWLEKKMGADIDGEGRIGSGPYKKLGIILLAFGMALACQAEDKTAIAYWSSRAKVDANGYFSGPGTYVTNIPLGGLAVASNKVTIGSAAGVGVAQTLSGDITTTTGGVVAIGAGRVANVQIAANAVTELPAHLNSWMDG